MNTPFMIYIGVGFHKRQTYEHFLPGVKPAVKVPKVRLYYMMGLNSKINNILAPTLLLMNNYIHKL
jgi:hypothetical protein